MRSFVLREMSILSHREKRARRIVFHPKSTVIKGANDTGKSSIIKSIYYSFGAEPQEMHSRWLSARTISIVTFEVDSKPYRIFRSGGSFSLFGPREEHIETTDKVTDGIGLEVSRILDFHLMLANRQGKTITPPPNYLFTPFYVDQDQGWSKTWNSFRGMGQIRNWRRELVHYYTGLRPNQYYQLRAEARSLETDREPLAHRIDVLLNVRSRLESKLSTAAFDIDVRAYKKEIDRLLTRCEILKKEEEIYRAKLVELDTERIRLEAQKEIVSGALGEINDDYAFATHKLEGDSVSCPTCGAAYENSFAERFQIARDEDRCLDLLGTLRDDLVRVKEEIKKHRTSLDKTRETLSEINVLLESRQGAVTLKTLLENEGRRELANQLDGDLASLRDQLTAVNTQLAGVEREANRFKDKRRAASTNSAFREYMRRHLAVLRVDNVSDKSFKRVDSVIKETGSDLPRAVLAHTFSLLRLIRDDGSATFCPILVDSPNQQDQDRENHIRMLEFVKREMPSGSQLVLGLVDDCGIDFGGKLIVLGEKNFALSERQYSEVALFMKPFEEVNLFSV